MIDSNKVAEVLTKRQALTTGFVNAETLDCFISIRDKANKSLGIKSIKPKELGNSCISVCVIFEDGTTLEGIVKKQDGQYIPIPIS